MFCFSTGNVGRTLLDHAAELAPILKIDQSVIEGLGNVYIALACKYVLDPVMFGALADEVDELLIKFVSWHPNVPAVHLNIAHGRYFCSFLFAVKYLSLIHI